MNVVDVKTKVSTCASIDGWRAVLCTVHYFFRYFI